MKISEKKLLALFSIATQAATMPKGSHFSDDSQEYFQGIIDSIINEQSDEFKEFNDEV